jgi:hypothetical protein
VMTLFSTVENNLDLVVMTLSIALCFFSINTSIVFFLSPYRFLCVPLILHLTRKFWLNSFLSLDLMNPDFNLDI